jgi:hypothetical protein
LVGELFAPGTFARATLAADLVLAPDFLLAVLLVKDFAALLEAVGIAD